MVGVVVVVRWRGREGRGGEEGRCGRGVVVVVVVLVVLTLSNDECFSITRQWACAGLGWQNTSESDSRRPRRHPGPQRPDGRRPKNAAVLPKKPHHEPTRSQRDLTSGSGVHLHVGNVYIFPRATEIDARTCIHSTAAPENLHDPHNRDIDHQETYGNCGMSRNG